MVKIIALLTAVIITIVPGQNPDNELELNILLHRLVQLVDSSSVLIDGGKGENARTIFKTASEAWGKYVEFHDYVAGAEFARTTKLDTLVAECSAGFETALKGDLAKELPAFKERLESLVISADLPILADFSGNSCKNCKIMKTRLTKIAPEYQGKVRIVYVNVNVERDLIKQYRVTLIPTLVFIGRDGKESSRFVGAMEENDLKKKLNDLQVK